MSTLEERLRSLNAARSLLQKASGSTALSRAFRDLAADIELIYPTEGDVEARLADNDLDKVQTWGTALSMTRTFLELVTRCELAQDDWRLQARGVERHFPEACYLPGSTPTDQPWTADFLDPWLGIMKPRAT